MPFVKLVTPRVEQNTEGHKTYGVKVQMPGKPGKDDVTYHFKPTDPNNPGASDQIAEVHDEDHLALFQSIPEGYEVLANSKAAEALDIDAALCENEANLIKESEIAKNAALGEKKKDLLTRAQGLRLQAKKLRLEEDAKIEKRAPKAKAIAEGRKKKELAERKRLEDAAKQRQKRAKDAKGKPVVAEAVDSLEEGDDGEVRGKDGKVVQPSEAVA